MATPDCHKESCLSGLSLPDSPPLFHSSLSQISSLTHSLVGSVSHSFSHTPYAPLLFPLTHLAMPPTRASTPCPPSSPHSLGSASHSLSHSFLFLISPLTHLVQPPTRSFTLCSFPHSLSSASPSLPHFFLPLLFSLTHLLQPQTHLLTLCSCITHTHLTSPWFSYLIYNTSLLFLRMESLYLCLTSVL